MQETIAVETWLYSLLSADATLTPLIGTRVYSYLAPQGAVFPFLLFALQAGADINSMAGTPGAANDRYLVKAVGKGSGHAALKAIMDRVQVLLRGTIATPTGLRIRAARIMPVQYVEQDEGVVYYHLGGVYRLSVSET